MQRWGQHLLRPRPEGIFAHAAFLVLSTAAAWARVIATRLDAYAEAFGLHRRGLSFEGLPSPQSGQFFDERLAVSEKALIACTEVVQSRFAIRRPKDPVLRAPSMAQEKDLACLTVAGQRIEFGLTECPLSRALQKVSQRSLSNIPQSVLRVDEVIARKEVAVVFDDRDIAAGLPKDTESVVLPEGGSGHLLEYLHLDLFDILVLPLVEDRAEKIAKGFSRRRTMAHTAFSASLRLNEGQEADEWGPDPFEEPVDLGGMVDVLCMYHA